MSSAIFLMYHDICDDSSHEVYTIGREKFASHLRTISDSGATVQTVQDYIDSAAERAIVITFDDGNASNLRVAAPQLASHGFRATFFLTTGFIGRKAGFMSWADVRELEQQDMEVGAHGHTHQFLTDLDDDNLRDELTRPRKMLQDEVGISASNMSAPGGRLNTRVMSVIRQNHYRSISSSIPRINDWRGQAQPEFGRFPITQKTSVRDFERIVNFDSNFARGQTLRFHSKRLIKGIIGNQRYQEYWNRKMR